MKIVYDAGFLTKLKKSDVRIREGFKQRVLFFADDPDCPELNNHSLRDEYQGYRRIDITADWRAIYKETWIGDEIVAYFVALETHEQLYGKKRASKC